MNARVIEFIIPPSALGIHEALAVVIELIGCDCIIGEQARD
ncbi:hypothetical protein ACP9OK_26060 [Pseudomonas sp. B11]